MLNGLWGFLGFGAVLMKTSESALAFYASSRTMRTGYPLYFEKYWESGNEVYPPFTFGDLL